MLGGFVAGFLDHQHQVPGTLEWIHKKNLGRFQVRSQTQKLLRHGKTRVSRIDKPMGPCSYQDVNLKKHKENIHTTYTCTKKNFI